HMWAPDVYQGGPTPVVAYMSCAPKATIVAFCLRLFWTDLNLHNSTFGMSLGDAWMLLFAVLSLLSMTMGNLLALPQDNLKRLLACSGISQVGYILMGVAASSSVGAASLGAGATLFYVWVYCFTNFACWSLLVAVLPLDTGYHRQELAGLARRSPFAAFALLICFMSLAGVPPLAGFVAKFYLFRAAFEAGMPWLVMLGVLNSVIALYYYFRVLRTAYFEEPADPSPLLVPGPLRLVLGIGVAVAMVMGLWPGLATWSLSTAGTLFASP
ncbi:MAG: proton-conducting transporter membrane subunit, partial [Candidatus Eremiobacterota bacterium]